MITAIKNCRACNSANIDVVFDLGEQVLTGVFQSEALDEISSGPVALVACNNCRLVQMQYTYPLDEMYNDGYGYQSGLTVYMSQHLKGILSFANDLVNLKKGDNVLDIGCNDGSLLNEFKKNNVDSNRIIFCRYANLDEHLERFKYADLFLDTFPYSAHTTANECLSSGTPLITIYGEGFHSRVAGSLLKNLHLNNLVFKTIKEYENCAIELAKNPTK